MSVVCSACKYENPAGSYHCEACGRRLVSNDTRSLIDMNAEETITCPRCDTTNSAESINCSQCGYYFATHPFPNNNRFRATFLVPPRILMNGSGQKSGEGDENAGRPVALDAAGINIHLIMNDQEKIFLNGAAEYTIGRADHPGNWEPAVDLTPYGGESGGVSRRHARIFIEDGQPYIEDLGSLNGTYINTVRLITRVPQPLHDGDQLLFGRVLVDLRIKLLKS